MKEITSFSQVVSFLKKLADMWPHSWTEPRFQEIIAVLTDAEEAHKRRRRAMAGQRKRLNRLRRQHQEDTEKIQKLRDEIGRVAPFLAIHGVEGYVLGEIELFENGVVDATIKESPSEEGQTRRESE